LNRLGREFTEIHTDEISSEGIADSVRKKRISKTAEFPPFEGRYYLTGHRGDRPGHNGEDVFYTDDPPETCLLCGRPLTPGVKERAKAIYRDSCEIRQDFVYQIPLVEVIGASLGFGAGSKKVTEIYHEIIKQAGKESTIWLEDEIPEFRNMPEQVTEGIFKIKKNSFKIEYGFDGKYGRIVF
jgi:PHP family Zn ribbon phosphoesterase